MEKFRDHVNGPRPIGIRHNTGGAPLIALFLSTQPNPYVPYPDPLHRAATKLESTPRLNRTRPNHLVPVPPSRNPNSEQSNNPTLVRR